MKQASIWNGEVRWDDAQSSNQEALCSGSPSLSPHEIIPSFLRRLPRSGKRRDRFRNDAIHDALPWMLRVRVGQLSFRDAETQGRPAAQSRTSWLHRKCPLAAMLKASVGAAVASMGGKRCLTDARWREDGGAAVAVQIWPARRPLQKPPAELRRPRRSPHLVPTARRRVLTSATTSLGSRISSLSQPALPRRLPQRVSGFSVLSPASVDLAAACSAAIADRHERAPRDLPR